MDGFKDFQGNSLDDAIREACLYFDTTRERLEIDIVQDAKTGIFGLVGVRKAKVRARRVQLRSAVDNALGRLRDNGHDAPPTPEAPPKRAKEPRQPRVTTEPKAAPPTAPSVAPAPPVVPTPASAPAMPTKGERPQQQQTQQSRKREKSPQQPEEQGQSQGQSRRHGHKPRPVKTEGYNSSRPTVTAHNATPSSVPAFAPPLIPPPLPAMGMDDAQADGESEGLRVLSLVSLTADEAARLRTLSAEVASRLVQPIVGEVTVRVDIEEGRVCVHVDSGEDSGLLIGREGQTLASLQYLASRMVSHGMNAIVRVQLDAGEYRLRQDDRLREMAKALAGRVRATGRPQSTRPLSSYHRRIIHMLFQDDPVIQTRSTGEGPLKRVVVQRRRA